MTKAIIAQTGSAINVAIFAPVNKLLLWDKKGYINVHMADYFSDSIVYENIDGQSIAEEIDLEEIANACILYAITAKHGSRPGQGDFKSLESALQKVLPLISTNIANPRDVAIEIIEAWNNLSLQRDFINSLVKDKTRISFTMATNAADPKIVQQNSAFELFLQALLQAFLLDYSNTEHIPKWALHQTIELFASCISGTAFNYEAENIARSWYILNQQTELINNTAPNPLTQTKLEILLQRFKKNQGEAFIISREAIDQHAGFPYFTVIAAEKLRRFYTFSDLFKQAKLMFDKYGIDLYQTDAFEHTILRLSSCTTMPTRSLIAVDPDNPQFFFIDCDLTVEALRDVANQLNARFQIEIAHFANDFRHAEMAAIRFNINLFMQLAMPEEFPKLVDQFYLNLHSDLSTQPRPTLT